GASEAAGRARGRRDQRLRPRTLRRHDDRRAAGDGGCAVRNVIMTDPRMYPDRPYLAVSAAIIRDGHVLVGRRAKGASTGFYTLPGGVVEAGETLHQAIVREIAEETGITIEPVALAGHREFITRDEA